MYGRCRVRCRSALGFEPLLPAAVHYRIAVGLHTGRRVLTAGRTPFRLDSRYLRSCVRLADGPALREFQIPQQRERNVDPLAIGQARTCHRDTLPTIQIGGVVRLFLPRPARPLRFIDITSVAPPRKQGRHREARRLPVPAGRHGRRCVGRLNAGEDDALVSDAGPAFTPSFRDTRRMSPDRATGHDRIRPFLFSTP